MAVLRGWVLAVSLLLAGGPLLAAETPTETGAFHSAYNQLRDTFWQQEISTCERLKKLLPPRGPWLDAKIIKAREKAGAH